MRFLMRAMLLVLAFSVGATQGAAPPPESAAELARTWQGMSVVLTARPIGSFMAWTRVNISPGMLGGGAAAAAEGNHIVTGNDVENQAPRIARALLESAQKHLGVMAASMTPLSLSATDGIASPAPPQVSTRFSYLCCLCTATRAVPKPGRLRSRVTAVARLGNRFAVPGYGE